MIILKIISRLLDYPTRELQKAKDEIITIINSNTISDKEIEMGLSKLTNEICEQDIYESQSNYDSIFEKGRSTSLLLFEHVHGESRDRGQAMVDLMEVYKSHGFVVSVKELPDYLPLFLEFLSYQAEDFIKEYLQDIIHILSLLQVRLERKQSNYRFIFSALIKISGVKISAVEVIAQVEKEKPDDTPEAIDEAWEDKEILFNDQLGQQHGACPTQQIQSEININVDSLKVRQY